MIVDDSHRLHEGIGTRRPEESPAPSAQIARQRFGFGRDHPRTQRLLIKPIGRIDGRKLPEIPGQAAVLGLQDWHQRSVADHSFDLAAVPDDPRIGHQFDDLCVVETCDQIRLKVGKDLPESIPLSQHGAPRQASLKAFQRELLEEPLIVGEGKSPLLIVVALVQLISGRNPEATCHGHSLPGPAWVHTRRVTEASIAFRNLGKTFGKGDQAVHAVTDLTVDVAPGRVTGFLGPNGAGKTTSLRCLLGLVSPTTGTALIAGQRYDQLPHPARQVGASLEATGFYPGRRARDHLRVVALAAGIPAGRVEAVLELVNLTAFADRRVGEYSLGMRQRLTLATALLGDPEFLILDEPANGLDPQGIAWLRGFLRRLAAEGRTVLVSSHVLSEVQQTVDDVIIISKGRLVLAQPLAQLVKERATPIVRLRGPDLAALSAAVTAADATWHVTTTAEAAEIVGPSTDEVGNAVAGLPVWELSQRITELENVFLELTGGPSQWAPPATAAVDPEVGA